MLIKTCIDCQYHMAKADEDMQKSYCGKECCWSSLTNCITQKAVERFLIEECSISGSPLELHTAVR